MAEDRNEAILIDRAKQGDRKAFEQLAAMHAVKIFNLALRFCNDRHLAEDIAQETLVKAYTGIKNFDARSPFFGWLYRITINTWKNRVRYEKTRKFFSHFSIFDRKDDEGNEAVMEIEDKDEDTEAAFDKKEGTGRVKAALASLDEQAREMIVLRDVEELSYEEIGTMLSISIGTVKSRIARSREKLRDILSKGEGD